MTDIHKAELAYQSIRDAALALNDCEGLPDELSQQLSRAASALMVASTETYYVIERLKELSAKQ